jgi:hypothetical protein
VKEKEERESRKGENSTENLPMPNGSAVETTADATIIS